MSITGAGGRGRAAARRLNLVELMVVFAIVGVVTAVAAGLLVSAVHRARDARTRTDRQTIEAAEEVFFTLHGRYATVEELLDQDVVAHPPSDLVVQVLEGGAGYKIVGGRTHAVPAPSPPPPAEPILPVVPTADAPPGAGAGPGALGALSTEPADVSPPAGPARSG